MSKAFNIAQVKLNGVAYGTKPGTASVRLGGVERSPDFADGDKLVKYETPVPCEITCTFIATSDTDFEAIRNFTGVAEFVLKDLPGTPTYSTSEAYIASPPELQPGNGVTVTIQGKPAEKTA